MADRKLKIQGIRSKRERWRDERDFPYIRLRGKWLEQAGAKVGSIADVEVHAKMIIIQF